MSTPLKLRAEDMEDLAVIAACLQDALVHVGEMTYLPRKRRFVAAFNRFVWEAETKTPLRKHCGMHFEGVLEAKVQGFDQSGPDKLLELLTIDCAEAEDGAATITLLFAGGAAVRLEVECIDCALADMGAPWQAVATPGHPAGEGE